jgi:hypothetical protein
MTKYDISFRPAVIVSGWQVQFFGTTLKRTITIGCFHPIIYLALIQIQGASMPQPHGEPVAVLRKQSPAKPG